MNPEQSVLKDRISATVEKRKDLKCDSENIVSQNSTHCSLFVYLQPPFISTYCDFGIMIEGVCLGKLWIFTTWTCGKKQWV